MCSSGTQNKQTNRRTRIEINKVKLTTSRLKFLHCKTVFLSRKIDLRIPNNLVVSSLQQTETTSRSQPFVSLVAVSDKRPSEEVCDVFQGLDPFSRNHTPKTENSSRQTSHRSKSELDDLFSVTAKNAGPTFVSKAQEPVKDSVTDLFDPLYNYSASSFETNVTKPCVTSTIGAEKDCVSDSKTHSGTGPQLISYGNSLISPQGNVLHPVSSSNENINPGLPGLLALSDLDSLSRNRTTQPQVTLPNTGLPTVHQYSSNFPNNSHLLLQRSVLSGSSTIPLRLPKQPSQRTDFGFVGKSGKADAFSFVQDEMKARK